MSQQSKDVSLNQLQRWYQMLREIPDDVIKEYLDERLENTWKCLYCGARNPLGVRHCSKCGRRDKLY